MKVFAGLVAFVAAQNWPSEFNTGDRFWLGAATESMAGSGGVAQINSIRCDRRAPIVEGSGYGEKHTKRCYVSFESLGMTGGYSDVFHCNAEVYVTVCKYCRQGPTFSASRADCASTEEGPQAVPYRGK